MTIIIPQWQGAGDRYAIRESIDGIERILPGRFVRVPGLTDNPSATRKKIGHYRSILRNLKAIRKFISAAAPEKIFLIGGDCSVELIPVSYLNSLYRNELSVLWFDAHGDLNTPDTSPSMNFHGMPLRLLLGEGDNRLKKHLPGFLSHDQVVLAGIRDADAPEREFIRSKSIRIITTDELKSGSSTVYEGLRKKIYMHIDLDVLDREAFHGTIYPVRDGIGMEDLLRTIRNAAASHEIVGMSIVEYNDPETKELPRLKDLIELGTRLTGEYEVEGAVQADSPHSPNETSRQE